MTDLLDVEYVTIGALMLAPQQLDQVRGWLRPTDFGRPLCGQMYELMLEMHTQQIPVDPVTVLDQLQRQGRVRADGRPGPEILTMVQSVPTPTAAAFYGRLVLEDALFREIAKVGDRLGQVGRNRRGSIEDAFGHAAGQQRALSELRERWAQARPGPRPVNADTAMARTRREASAEPAQQARAHGR